MRHLFVIGLLSLLAQFCLAKPLVIAHRGASGYLPEHTNETLVMAYMQGADFIEQDLVLSKDGHLVVLHDIHIDSTTNVAEQFPERMRKDGRYYAIDFTLMELKSLLVHERTNSQQKPVYPQRFQGSTDFRIATLDEHINLVQQLNRQTGKNTGWYMEIKAPQWHFEQSRDIAQILVAKLSSFNLNKPNANVFIQCFDFRHSQRLRQKLGLKTKLIQLIGENDWQESDTNYDYLKTEQGLADIASFADGIGPWIPQVLTLKNDTYQSTGYAESAQKAGLSVHPYTFRKDALADNVTAEALLNALFNRAKVDGVFTDFPDTVINYLNDSTAQ